MIPPDLVAKQFGIKIKSDRYHEKYYPLDFRLSKTARELGVTETASREEVSDAARKAWSTYDHEVARLTKELGYGRAWIDIGRGDQIAVLTDPDFAVICSDVDLLAVFDPEDDVTFAYDVVGSGVETTRQRALVTALKPVYVEHGIEAQNPDARFPIRDGKAHCRGQPYDRLDEKGWPRQPCSAGLEIRGKWFLYRIDIEYTDDAPTGFVGPSPIKVLQSESEVVEVFNDRGYNPRSVPPNLAWEWRTLAPGRWAPSAEHEIPKSSDPAARRAGPLTRGTH